MTKVTERWALLFRSDNRLDGYREHLIWDRLTPKLFPTRREAREWKDKHYGYISRRRDLQQEPHGWKPVKVVRVRASYEIIGAEQ